MDGYDIDSFLAIHMMEGPLPVLKAVNIKI